MALYFSTHSNDGHRRNSFKSTLSTGKSKMAIDQSLCEPRSRGKEYHAAIPKLVQNVTMDFAKATCFESLARSWIRFFLDVVQTQNLGFSCV